MTGQAATLDSSGAAILHIARERGAIVHCNDAAAKLFGIAPGEPGATDWCSLLGITSPESALARAVAVGVRTAVPPTLLNPPATTELVVGGYLYPQNGDACADTVILLLFALTPRTDLLPGGDIETGDVVAVLGVEPAPGASPPAPAEAARIMMDVRAGLQQIVPAAQDVGLPRGTAVALLLRETDIEQAVDISGAVLSHLGPVLASRLRARIGLARRESGDTALASLVAANTALLRLQRADPGEAIAVANEQDQTLLAAAAATGDGVFSSSSDSDRQRAYLSALISLEVNPQRDADYLEKVLELTAGQPGVAAVAVYRRDREDGFDFVAAAAAAAGGVAAAAEKALPRALRRFKPRGDLLSRPDTVLSRDGACAAVPLSTTGGLLGYMALHYPDPAAAAGEPFTPGVAALHHLSRILAAQSAWRDSPARAPTPSPPPPPVEVLEGYVADNMEGAIDQAVFLAQVDIPVAVIGPRGTGKLYVARIIHREWGGAPDDLVVVDCRAFRGRKEALNRIARELAGAEGKTLVFKSPHLMNADAQLRLARQISSRVLADSNPPRYLPAARFVALFPDSIEHLMKFGGLNERLASVFAGYPIVVPPIRDRKRAVLRWAQKILAQEAARRDRRVSGFTPDAEQAMLLHEWPGNISEMRQCISAALDKSDKDWLTPVDIGLFRGVSGQAEPGPAPDHPFLQRVMEPQPQQDEVYSASPLEDLDVALGEALHNLLEAHTVKPLGSWLDDELVLAVCERFRDNRRAAAEFLHTRPRNIGRWMPAILSRDHERSSSMLWQAPRQLVRQWVLESPAPATPPQQMFQARLISLIQQQCDAISVADRAAIMGMSTPTYQKRLREHLGENR